MCFESHKLLAAIKGNDRHATSCLIANKGGNR